MEYISAYTSVASAAIVQKEGVNSVLKMIIPARVK